jgi:uncharacterized spore protein YtfJ
MEELNTLLERIDSIGDEINVDAVFGTPETVGDRVLIPVAEIAFGYGAGMGVGSPVICDCCEECDHEEGDESCECECECECHEMPGEGMGGGGGAGGRARPIAYIEVGPEGTKVEPIMDEQKIALAGMLLGAWAIAWAGTVLVALFKAIAGRD